MPKVRYEKLVQDLIQSWKYETPKENVPESISAQYNAEQDENPGADLFQRGLDRNYQEF